MGTFSLRRLLVSTMGPVLGAALWLVSWSGQVQAAENVSYVLDFTGQPDGSAVAWLQEHGFDFRLGADGLNPRFRNGRLYLSADGESAGLFVKSLWLPNVTRMRVSWGVERYPLGANWEQDVHAVPIAVMVSFGDKVVDSGALYLPDAPYFIGVFLGQREREGKPYTGRFYKTGGRYFCMPCGGEAGKEQVTVFDLQDAFVHNFKEATPPVSSVGFQMNTRGTDGTAVAYLKRIEFLGRGG